MSQWWTHEQQQLREGFRRNHVSNLEFSEAWENILLAAIAQCPQGSYEVLRRAVIATSQEEAANAARVEIEPRPTVCIDKIINNLGSQSGTGAHFHV